jgi:hypothetical protein
MCALYQKSTKYVDCIGTTIIYLWCWHIDHDHQPPRIYPLSCFHNKLVSYPCIHLVSIGPRTCIFGIHYNHTSLKYKYFLFSSYLFFQLFCDFKSSWINKQLHSLSLTNHKILIGNCPFMWINEGTLSHDDWEFYNWSNKRVYALDGDFITSACVNKRVSFTLISPKKYKIWLSHLLFLGKLMSMANMRQSQLM